MRSISAPVIGDTFRSLLGDVRQEIRIAHGLVEGLAQHCKPLRRQARRREIRPSKRLRSEKKSQDLLLLRRFGAVEDEGHIRKIRTDCQSRLARSDAILRT